MKKIIFSLIALLACTSINAQIMQIMKGGNIVATFSADIADKVVFKEDPGVTGDYVDLGLPSGTLWATRNLGAERPEDAGDYFAWGETEKKEAYWWSTYKYYQAETSPAVMTKYNADDKFTTLKTEDDAAFQELGDNARIPTIDELNELFNTSNTTIQWIFMNGKPGYLITSKTNSNSIFLPAAGFYEGTTLRDMSSGGRYWSSTLHKEENTYSMIWSFNSTDNRQHTSLRYYGRSIRPVKSRSN